MKSNFTIRVEEQRDFKTVENLTRESFWNVYRPGCTEHYVLHCFRDNPDFIPALSLVMEKDGQIIGHVMFSKAELEVEKEDITMCLDAIQEPISLQEPVYGDGNENIYVLDQVKDKKNTDELWAESITISEAMKKLN